MNKGAKLIIRIDKEYQDILNDMRTNYDVNVSSMVRRLILDYYEYLKRTCKNEKF
jgi:hypothetical protein